MGCLCARAPRSEERAITSQGRTEWIKVAREGTAAAVLGPLGLFAVLALVVLSASRLGLVLWQFDRVRAAHGPATVLAGGLRFDLLAIGAVLFFPLLILPALMATRRFHRLGQRLLWLVLTAELLAFAFMEFATPSFIAEYDARPNYLFVEYLRYPVEVASTLWGAYPLQLAGAVIAAPLLCLALYRLFRRTGELAGPLPVRTAVLLTVVLSAACLLAARSSVGHRPANPSAACFSNDAMVNTLPLNSVYSAGYAVYELNRHERGKLAYGTLPVEDVLDIVREAAGLPPENFDQPEIPTLHTQSVAQPRVRPLNLVIVLEESLGSEFVGALGGLPLTPNLDRLLDEGMAFDRLYATGTRSVRGIEAVITGFYPTPSRAVVKLPRAQRGFFTVAELLRRRGYATSFIYGGDAGFDNMGRFFTGNGFETIIDQDDYRSPYFAGSWGVSDQDLFRRAHAEFEQAGDRPFFSLVFTTSNHTPWEYPEGEIEPYEQPAATRNNAVKYSDHALGEFFRLARGSSYWDRTVFLVVADHNSRTYGPELVPVDRFHVPGVFLGGTITPEHVDTVASQVDLVPTALSLIGMNALHPMLGRDLTDPRQRARPGRALMQFHKNFLYLEGDRAVVLREGQPPADFAWDDQTLAPLDSGSPSFERRALAHVLWPQLSYRAGDYRLPPTDDHLVRAAR